MRALRGNSPGVRNGARLGAAGLDVTVLANGTYDLRALIPGLVATEPFEFALHGPGQPASNTDIDGTQLKGGDGGGLIYGRAYVNSDTRDYRLIVSDTQLRLEGNNGSGGSTWTTLAATGGNSGVVYTAVHWTILNSTIRQGGLGSSNDVEATNNWPRRGGGAAGFLSNGADGPNGTVYTADGNGGGGVSTAGNTSGAAAGASPNRNGGDYGGGAGADYGGLGTPGRGFARFLARSNRTFPSAA